MKNEKHRNLRPKDTKRTLLRLFSYIKYNKGMFFGGILFIILGAMAEISTNAMLSPMIDELTGDRNLSLIIKYIIIMGMLVALIAIGQYFGNLFMVKLSQRTVHKIREDLFSHMEKLPVSFFDKHSHGDLMSTFTNDVDMLTQSMEQSISQITLAIITVVGTFIMMIILSPILTLVVVLMLAVMMMCVKYVGKKSSRNFREQQAALADLNSYVEEMILGQKVIKVFNYEDRAINDFERKNEKHRKASSLASAFGVMLMPVMGNLSYFLYALVSIIGAFFVMIKKLSLGNIASFLQYTRTISRPITQASNQFNMIFAALAGAERIFNVLDEDVELDEGDVRLLRDGDETYWAVPKADGSFDKVPLKGHITFENVRFGYNPGKNTLKNINLYAKPGQKVAFVGSTGAGKTTVTNLINRFYEINDGTILYDGIDIRRINKSDLRSTMSIVLQDVHLFEGTIADNIRYGKLDATDDEVKKAARLANADYFIRQLPKGYDTMLTADGQNLSQGERQLLSIARAAVANPVILILDEATSSVDTRTEKLIAEGMDKLMKGRTTFVIAHRLSTVRDADVIIVLDHGKIIERGSHDNLMQQKGRYYQLNAGIVELD